MSTVKNYMMITGLTLAVFIIVIYLAFLTGVIDFQNTMSIMVSTFIVLSFATLIISGKEAIQKSESSISIKKKWFNLLKFIASIGLVIGFVAFGVQIFGVIDISFYSFIVLLIVIFQVFFLNVVKYRISSKKLNR